MLKRNELLSQARTVANLKAHDQVKEGSHERLT